MKLNTLDMASTSFIRELEVWNFHTKNAIVHGNNLHKVDASRRFIHLLTFNINALSVNEGESTCSSHLGCIYSFVNR